MEAINRFSSCSIINCELIFLGIPPLWALCIVDEPLDDDKERAVWAAKEHQVEEGLKFIIIAFNYAAFQEAIEISVCG